MVVIVIVITTTVASQWLIITPSLPRAVPACLHAPQTLKPNPSTLQAHEHRSTGAGSLSAQEGLPPLLKRLFILHSSKLMALAVFWAAMQQPGAIGWLLTCELSQVGTGFSASQMRLWHSPCQRTPLGCNPVSHVSACWLTGLGLGTSSRYLARTISWNACKLAL